MEALHNLGIDGKLLLAQVVNFLILLFILRKFAYRPMLEFLEKRTARIEQGIKDAEAAGKRLEEAARKEEKMLVQAREEARSLVAKAEIAAEKRAEAIMDAVELKSQAIFAESKKHAEAEREKIFREAKEELASLVLLATGKMLKEKSEGKNDRELAERFLGTR